MRKFQAGHHRGNAIGRLKRQLLAVVETWFERGIALPVPLAGVPIFAAFVTLSRARRWTEAGPCALTYAEIAAWAHLVNMHLPPHHLDVLTALDAAWLEGQAKAGKDGPPVPLTAAAFDAGFG